MLSLKASRADNFYYGSVEDEDLKKKKEKNLKKINKKDYNTIKFEIPYTIICKNCNIYIYKGERFNSERRKAGYYLSTCFYSFSIFCKKCQNKIVIETNPQKCSYDIIEGARKKNEHYENILTEGGINNINYVDFEQNKKKKTNPFMILEINALNKKKKNESEEHFENNILNDDDQKSDSNRSLQIKDKESDGRQIEENNDILSKENKYIDKPIDDTQSDEDINDVIKETYKRNVMLKNDFGCNRTLRKQLRDIKNEKIQKRKENIEKNIFINILKDPCEDLKVKKFLHMKEKYKKTINEKTKLAKNNLIKKKSSIFDKKYLKNASKKKG
ncbi:conserved protein, unknown function [Plasmodium chabaudi chabaudi]|uniref:CWC16 domain-containing protein n=1 Tax=Plasmodium chabaudi chabaudi TaxID=31271 RepID=A0A1C6YTH2_PLACU|nr:conserved protein, unknown function [Plasmodium chabaudi chabaudi]